MERVPERAQVDQSSGIQTGEDTQGEVMDWEGQLPNDFQGITRRQIPPPLLEDDERARHIDEQNYMGS